MVSKKAVKVAIKDLRINLFVRKELDVDRVLDFALKMESGVEFPPIIITPNMDVIDGRHRIEGADTCGRTEILAVFQDVQDEVELICTAYNANVGGALPPTTNDTEHTVMLLL